MRVLAVALRETGSVFVVKGGSWGSLLIRVVSILCRSLFAVGRDRGSVSDKVDTSESLSFLGVARSLAHS